MFKKSIVLSFFIYILIPGYLLAEDKLLQSSDFTYLGAFRVPTGEMGSGIQYQGLGYGGSVIAYNPAKNSLFIVGHDNNQQVGEISIPALVISSNVADLNRATLIQNLIDISEGNMVKIRAGRVAETDNRVKIGGLLVYGNKLIGSAYNYYDGGYTAIYSHFKSGLTLATAGDFEGMFEVGNKPNPVPQAGFVGGYMAPIPTKWQTVLGGKILTGLGAVPVLSRTSAGNAAFAFDPDQLNMSTPAPTSALLYYNLTNQNCIYDASFDGGNICDNQTIGSYYTSGTIYNKGSRPVGVIFPSGSRSVIFYGKQGTGPACYGLATNILSEQGNRYNYPPPNNTCMGIPITDTSVSDQCCYDPEGLADKGSHAYPYKDFAWAYDAADFARVKAGGRIVDNPSPNLVTDIVVDGRVVHAGVSPTSTQTYKPWHIKPYSMWEINFPTPRQIFGLGSGAATYDESRKILYIAQVQTEGDMPVIHAFKVNTDVKLFPAAPRNMKRL